MASLILEDLEPDVRIVRGPTNLGIVAAGNGTAILIDSGNDEDAGRKLLRTLEADSLKLALIVNTHSNADHCGGNAFLQARTGCRIAATREEAAFIETPLLEPSLLWGGGPPAVLRNKFLMAKPSKVTDVISPSGTISGTNLEAVPLPGHFVGMIGIRTPGGALFCADALASEEILAKYPVFFLYDVAAQLRTLDFLESYEATAFVPCHAAPTTNVRPLVEANRRAVARVNDTILDIAKSEPSWEEMLSGLVNRLAIELNPSQYSLVHSSIRAHLAYLQDSGELSTRFEGGKLRITIASHV
jgi:glyoxylase-like metal-dependent hydrolase (beta-lactamase superfamily II)